MRPDWKFHQCVCWPPTCISRCTWQRYLGEREHDANRCSFKRAENYVSNISGACFKEFMFCIWNGRRSPVYTLNNLSSQPARLRDWISISLISPVLVYLFHYTFPHFYSRGESTGFSPSFSLAPARNFVFLPGRPSGFDLLMLLFRVQ